jgi:hypothetical protein
MVHVQKLLEAILNASLRSVCDADKAIFQLKAKLMVLELLS